MKFSRSLIQGLLLDDLNGVFVSKEIGVSVLLSRYIFFSCSNTRVILTNLYIIAFLLVSVSINLYIIFLL